MRNKRQKRKGETFMTSNTSARISEQKDIYQRSETSFLYHVISITTTIYKRSDKTYLWKNTKTRTEKSSFTEIPFSTGPILTSGLYRMAAPDVAALDSVKWLRHICTLKFEGSKNYNISFQYKGTFSDIIYQFIVVLSAWTCFDK